MGDLFSQIMDRHGLMLVISPPFAVTRLKGGFANVEISLLLWQILLIDLHFCGNKETGLSEFPCELMKANRCRETNLMRTEFFKLWLKDF